MKNRIKILVLSACSLALLAGAPFDLTAGLNPAAPGLPTAVYNTVNVANNGFSSMCVDCHGRNPVSGATHYGSHFVAFSPNATGAAVTHSGGGWDNTQGGANQAGVRTNGAYFKVTAWPSTGFSKYGQLDTDNSYSTSNVGNHTGIVDTGASTYASREIICESCHNILINSAGGNNLLTAPINQNVAGAELVGAANTPNICVGCHGDMYSVDGANTTIGGDHATKYGGDRNLNEVAGSGRKGVNSVHTINGIYYNMNHHVTTGDSVNATTVGVGLSWRDTLAIDPSAVLEPVSNSLVRGQMPQKAWIDDKVKPPTAVNCLNCHAHGHNGNNYTGASILRDTSTLKAAVPTDEATNKGLARIGEGGRAWFDFNDYDYCNDCHTLATGR